MHLSWGISFVAAMAAAFDASQPGPGELTWSGGSLGSPDGRLRWPLVGRRQPWPGASCPGRDGLLVGPGERDQRPARSSTPAG
jgi:hypothetical protein